MTEVAGRIIQYAYVQCSWQLDNVSVEVSHEHYKYNGLLGCLCYDLRLVIIAATSKKNFVPILFVIYQKISIIED